MIRRSRSSSRDPFRSCFRSHLGFRFLLVWATALALTDCKPSRAGTDRFPRAETLYLGGRQWGEPRSFNPLASSPDWPVEGLNLLYETLFVYDWTKGRLVPLLGESYTLEERGLSVRLNPAARWNDGRPVTAEDVEFSFDLGRRYPSVRVAPLWKYLSDVRITEPGRIVLEMDEREKNPLVLLDALQDVRIVPRHVIEPLLERVKGDFGAFSQLKFDENPVGSGPYRLHSYSSEKIVLERDDAYWGNSALFDGEKPRPKYIIHPIYKNGDHFSVALQQGRLDASCTFVPRIWLKHRKGVRTWYDDQPFFVSLGIPMLIPNVTRPPLDDVKMRRAMAFAINYRDIRELAVSGYSAPRRPGLILPFGLEAQYFSERDAERYGTRYDPARARALLREAGYRGVYSEDGELIETRDKSGKRVPTVTIKSPTGWSDYESIVRIAVRSLRAVGIDARERFVDASLYWPARYTGDFDLLMDMPPPEPTPSKPWSRFEVLLTSKEWVPEGQKAYKNFGRFNDPRSEHYLPRFDELLSRIPTLEDEKTRSDAYRELNRLFMQYQPTLPLVYRPDQYYEFSIRHWKNFPTASNAFLPPQLPGDRLGTRVLWELAPSVVD